MRSGAAVVCIRKPGLAEERNSEDNVGAENRTKLGVNLSATRHLQTSLDGHVKVKDVFSTSQL